MSVASVSKTSSSAATATLAWTWPVGQGWTYTSKAAAEGVRLGLGGRSGASDLVEPELKAGERLSATGVSAKRADILGPHGVGLVTDRPVLRFGVDRLKVPASQAADSARRLAQLVGIDVAPYVQQVKAAGPKAFIQAIVYRQDEVPASVTAHYTDIKGVDAIAGELPLGPDQGVRGADPRHRRPGHRRDHQGQPRRLPSR